MCNHYLVVMNAYKTFTELYQALIFALNFPLIMVHLFTGDYQHTYCISKTSRGCSLVVTSTYAKRLYYVSKRLCLNKPMLIVYISFLKGYA